MKQYRTLAAIGFILFLSWTLFICHAVSQVKFTQLERSSIKWTIPVAKRVVPGIPDFVMTYMTLANLIDSTEIELGTKIDSMKWATGDTLKLYTSDGIFKTKITFTGMGTVTNVTGTSPIIITGTSTVTPNVTIQNASTSQTGALTSTDWNTFNGKIGGSGVTNRLAYYSGTNAITSSDNLTWDGTNKVTIKSSGGNPGLFIRDLSPLSGGASESQLLLGVGSTLLGADDRFFQLKNTYQSATSHSRLNVTYWDGTGYNDIGYWERDNGFRAKNLGGYDYFGTPKAVNTSLSNYEVLDIYKSSTYRAIVGMSNNGLYLQNTTNGGGAIHFYTGEAGSPVLSSNISGTGVFNITNLSGTGTRIVTASSTGDLSTGVATSVIGTVTSVGVSGSDFTITGTNPVTTSGTIGLAIADGVVGPNELASTSVAAGVYTNTNITVDADGRITAAANGSAGSGVTTLAAIGSSPNANGATISGSTLNLQPASASFGGVVTTGTQTFAGSKTFDYLGGTEGTNLTTGTSLIMATNAGKLENLYGTVAGYDLPLYNPTGNNWELTKLKTVNGNSLLGSGNVALTTDLSFTGASSPYTLNSNTGNDVTFAAGSGVTLSRSGDQLTIAASGMTSWNLAASGTAGSASITNGSTATITAGSGITATRSGNNITISSAAAGGEQFWTTTTNATSHEIILKDHAGTTNVSALKLIEGAGIELTTSAGTFSNSNLTITNTGDLLTTNEGYLGVGAGGATSSTLQGYNSSGTATGSGMTFNAGQGLLISETTSTNGGQITYTLNQHNTQMEVVSDITSATYDGTYRKVNFTQDIPGTGFTFSAANDEITVSTTGVYEISYGASYEIQNGASNVTEWTVYIGGSSSYNSKSFQTDVGSANPNAISKTFLVTLAAGNTVSLRYTRSAGTGTLIDIFSPVISISRLN